MSAAPTGVSALVISSALSAAMDNDFISSLPGAVVRRRGHACFNHSQLRVPVQQHTGATIMSRRCVIILSRSTHNPNTNSIDDVEVCLSSGMFAMMTGDCREPTSTATYCLPLTE